MLSFCLKITSFNAKECLDRFDGTLSDLNEILDGLYSTLKPFRASLSYNNLPLFEHVRLSGGSVSETRVSYCVGNFSDENK